MVSSWILCTWNAGIPWIIELPLRFSVAKAGAGDKTEISGEELEIICTKY
jgi:hypothetical protein